MQPIYAGQQIVARVRAIDPVTKAVITDADGVAYFYAPPKNPQENPGDRTYDEVVSLTFDPVSRFYLAAVDTSGWAPGDWWMQGVITGGTAGYNSWSYYPFPVSA